MSHSKRTKIKEDRGFSDTFLLLVKLKNHSTYRVENCGRHMETVQKKYREHEKLLEKFKIIQVNGFTGELSEFKLWKRKNKILIAFVADYGKAISGKKKQDARFMELFTKDICMRN